LAPDIQPNWYTIGFVAAVAIGIGAVTAQASLDLELGTGALHYSMYLLTTMVLRAILVGYQNLLWQTPPETPASAAAHWLLHAAHLVTG
ncbi:MAG TPA: hypothetical protein VFV87_22930, partial [Pirellulaceae bacterium]|nr:hypothetical protein [Pirellulaceae bacterium]